MDLRDLLFDGKLQLKKSFLRGLAAGIMDQPTNLPKDGPGIWP